MRGAQPVVREHDTSGLPSCGRSYWSMHRWDSSYQPPTRKSVAFYLAIFTTDKLENNPI